MEMTGDDPGPDLTAFHGGRILSMDPQPEEPEVVVLRGDMIDSVGPAEMLEAHPEAARVDLGGRTLLPGFVDAHNHLSIASLLPAWLDLSQVSDQEVAVADLVEHASAHPEQAWVGAWGWNAFETGFALDARVLDRAGLARPVVVVDFSFHRAAVCSLGLERLGIARATEDPPGGTIERKADGNPTGVLVERAWTHACDAVFADQRTPERLAGAIVDRARILLSEGITCVHDAACPPEAEVAYARLASDGRLPLGVVTLPHPGGLLGRLDRARLDGSVTGEGDDMVRTGAIKLFADGGIAPAFKGTLGGTPVEFGMLMPGLAEDMRLCVSAGFDVAVHAFGNAGFELALEAWEEAGGPAAGRRLRIEHACLVSPAQARRAADLGVTAVVQPGFVAHVGALLGSLQFDGMDWMPFATMREVGVPIAASSDDPCALHEPRLTAAMGARRAGPGRAPLPPAGEAFSYEEWLCAYTRGAAAVGGQESIRGRIAPGMRADLVVLEGELDPNDPPIVSETWVGGRAVFRRSSPATG
ncbi:MAG: hypothetical protein DYH08_04330 [Actinobacteria bacterium ATB1]|nr:hypothetical protein [Actinobacteria bacterium ATB1]